MLVAFTLTVPLLTGCWDRQEIEQRAVVLGIGVDESGENVEEREGEISHLKGSIPAPARGSVRVTLQIAVPGRIPLGPGGGGGGGQMGGGGGQNTVWVVDGIGKTIDDALNNLQQRIAPPLFYGHLRVIVISEAVSKKGIQSLNDTFRRNPEIRRMAWMVVCRGQAADIMKVSPQLERVPTFYLMDAMDMSVKMGRFPDDFLGIFWSSSSAKGREGFLPYVLLKEKGMVQVSGMAFFKNDKMVGTTKPLEVAMYMGIIGENPAGGEGFVEVPGTKENMLFGARNRKSTIKATIKEGKPHIEVNIIIEGNILEKTSEQVTLSNDVIMEIEKELEARTKTAYQNLIKKTQEKGSDIFGFGEQIRAKQPRFWNREIKTKENWQNMYKELSVDLSVQMNIRRIGMKAT
nr:Ger(x)C family spore germination protein [Paenibacillus hamazuiensis]